MERSLGELRLCAMVIDGILFNRPVDDRFRWDWLRWPQNGAGAARRRDGKHGRDEELVSEMAERGVDFSTPQLYILDGGKALAAAVRKHAGKALKVCVASEEFPSTAVQVIPLTIQL